MEKTKLIKIQQLSVRARGKSDGKNNVCYISIKLIKIIHNL